MDSTSWLRQTPDKPLFPDMLWSRPENKRAAGKLLIAGGNSHSFSAVSSAYLAAQKSGVGSVKVVLPDSLERALAKSFPEAEFVPATPSGSFARTALALILDAALWANGVLLAGDFGKNSETAILLDSFIQKYHGQLTLTGDSIDYFSNNPTQLLDRPKTSLALSLAQLQKILAGRALIKHSMDLIQLINTLGSLDINCSIVTHHNNQVLVSFESQVSSTPSAKELNPEQLAPYISVWGLQHPAQNFEALTTAVHCFVSA